jgi:hypothetical protein
MNAIDLEGYLLSKGLRVKRTGTQLYTTCVFCNEAPEKRGRLYLDDSSDESRGLYYCHLCNEKGNIHTLRKHFGDPPLDDEGSIRGDRSRRIFNEANDFYRASLTDDIRSYLRTVRGLTDETIQKFSFGWAPRGSSLAAHLKSLGFEWDEMLATGLVRTVEDNKVTDFFQDAITFPYLVAGSAVQIRGRKLMGDNKYLTPAGQPARLFNTDAVWGAKEVVVCEGEIDAMALTQVGYNAVAVPGAANWSDAWNGYFEDAQRVFVMYDPDEVGQKNTLKVLDALGAKAKNVVLPVPDGKSSKEVDPNWLIANEHWGYGEFRNVLDDSIWANSLLVSPRDAHKEWEDVQGVDGFKLGLEVFDDLIRPGLLPGQVMVPLAKAEPLTNEIPTPSGFRQMGDLNVGDAVFGSDGRRTTVTGVFPQGKKACFEVTFSDRSAVTVSGDHLWQVTDWGVPHQPATRVASVKEILKDGLRAKGRWRFQIPTTAPVRYRHKSLPVEPYTLGSIIANGSTLRRSVILSTPDHHVVDRISEHYECSTHHVNPGECGRYGIKGVIAKIRDLGLVMPSGKKFIPDIYLTASVDQRIALLQGLMDGDGSAERSKPHTVSYSTISPRLAQDVATLVTSLGGTAAINRADRSHEGKSIEFRVSIMLPSEVQPFHTPRKRGVKPEPRVHRRPRRSIISITPVGYRECQCIAVAASDSLYLTSRSHIVTHNTNSGKTMTLLNIFQRAAMVPTQQDAKMLFISLEQTRGDWFERARRIWNFYNLDCDPQDVNKKAIEFWEPRLRLVDKNRISPDEFCTILSEYEEQMGKKPDLVAVDYLGYWARAFPGRDRYTQVGDAVMELKAIAKEFRIPIIAPHQVNRSAEFGEEFSIDQARDSGAIEETADFVMSLWNPDSLKGKDEDNRTGTLNLMIGKSRHGGKGQKIKLQFGYMTLVVVPQEDEPFARRARNEISWSLDSRLNWTDAIRAHATGTTPKVVANLPGRK